MHVIDRGSGTPVVLIPGIQGRWEWTTPAIDALSQRCRVLTFSLCDEPTSRFEHDPSKGVENYLAQLEAVLDRAGIREAVMVGVSYSGPIAAEFAIRHPERVRALVLVSALPTDWQCNRRARFYLRAPLLLSPLFLFDAPIRALPEIRTALPRRLDRAAFGLGQLRRALGAFLSPTRMATRLRWLNEFRFSDVSTIQTRVLVITGEPGLDRVVDPELTRRYIDAIPGARHAVIAGTGHLGLLTKSTVFAELVARFADETEPDERRASA